MQAEGHGGCTGRTGTSWMILSSSKWRDEGSLGMGLPIPYKGTMQ